MQLTHLIVEPGERLADALVQSGYFDRLWVIRSPRALLGHDPGTRSEAPAPRAASMALSVTARRELDGDDCAEYLNPASDVFFAQRPSPEFSL
jgi:riboflavin biosynthesis pyrimidine reductase